ncbi:MAG TPA: hypothetical protein VFD16_01980 [Candidatus Saccharimonadales bacterium]|nr:hypothetical protein [Candidatus Saccharimonadales bacterium]
MFKNFLALLLAILVLRWCLPPETVSLANEILVKILTLISNSLAMINLPSQ